MTAPAPPLDRAALRRLCEEATPGPWVACSWDPMERPHVSTAKDHHPRRDAPVSAQDADLIAAARSALPALLDALEAAEARIARVEALAEEYDGSGYDGRIAADLRRALKGTP